MARTRSRRSERVTGGERERLLELYGMHAVSPAPDRVLDAFVEKVAKLFRVPTCVVSLVLEDRQWFKSSFGCPVELALARETPRNISFCTHVVATEEPLIVRDAFQDPRFADNPLVNRHRLSFYAGFPLRTSSGHVLGSLCLYDQRPRDFSAEDMTLLGLFSERVIAHLELCRELGRAKAAEAQFSGILGIAGDAIISLDEAQRIIIFNREAERMFGYTAAEALGQPVETLVPERFRSGHRDAVQGFGASLDTGRRMGERGEIYGRRKNGGEFPAEASISKLHGPEGLVFTVVLRDISARKRSEQELHLLQTITLEISEANDLHSALEIVLRRICEATGWIVGQAWIPNPEQTALLCNPSWYAGALGLERFRTASEERTFPPGQGLPGRVWASKQAHWIPDVSQDGNFPRAVAARHAGLKAALGIPVVAGDEVIAVIEFFVFEPRQEDAGLIDLVSAVAEQLGTVVRRKQAEEALAIQAIRDALTGLYNRRYFNERADEELAKARRGRYTLAFLLCDLDRFKAVNDTHGHQAGDALLREVSQALQSSTRGTDLVFRWGGDEFVIVLTETSHEGITIAAHRVRGAVRALDPAQYLDLDVSIGVALYPEHGDDVDELIRLADRALYIAKKGGDKIHIGDEEYHLSDAAVATVFQPVIDLRTSEPVGYEALARNAKDLLVSPLDLFKRFQAIGQLRELKALCFRAQLKRAEECGIRRLFVNVDFDLLSYVGDVPLPPGMEVVLEISELEAIRDITRCLKQAQQWRAAGFTFAIDDFGSGFVSLPFIAELVPEYIKVDRSAVLQAVSSSAFQEFMIGLIFGLRNYAATGVIAEGVETDQELQVVRKMGITLVQGFLFGKPSPFDESADL